jgi:Ca2+:H+ antiporter
VKITSLLLLFVPVAVALEHLAPDQHLWVFLASALAIVPCAGWMGKATEELAVRTGEGIGGLLNATFGNAAELIIAFAALRAGLHDVVKASLAGSIIGNILLVLGAAMLAGGLRHREQHFNPGATRSQATMLTLAAIGLFVPAAYAAAVGPEGGRIGGVSVAIALVLLVTYALNLLFVLVTHRTYFSGDAAAEHAGAQTWGVGWALGVLAVATVGIAWMSEMLVGAVEPAAHALGMNSVFVGIFVVAILGNAAEHATAVTAALGNRMELSLGIAVGSSVQIALFVTPVLVLASLGFGPRPMDLVFFPGLVLTVFFAVLVLGQVSGDGESNWIKGVQLLAVYLILAIVFYFAPGKAPQ